MGKFADSVDKNLNKHEDRMDLIFKQATSDLIAGIEIGPSITRSGHRKHGTIPRDLSTLANSLTSTLFNGAGSIDAVGPISHTFVISQAEIGDKISFSWGGAAADYAHHVHYGANGVKGTFWIDVAASKWPKYVAEATIAAKAMIL